MGSSGNLNSVKFDQLGFVDNLNCYECLDYESSSLFF